VKEASSGQTSRATLSDVCRTARLSSATVSRVLNRKSPVSAATREKVMRVVADLGYVPNHAARTLAGGREQMLGVVFPEIGNGFWAEILKGLDAAAAAKGFHLLTAFSHGEVDEQELVLRLHGAGRIDALIVMNLRLGEVFAREASRFKTPVVLIDRPIPGLAASTITIDNARGAQLAMSHLYEHGYSDIAILGGDLATFDSQQRLKGCEEAAQAAGVKWNPDRVIGGAFTEESGTAAMNALIDGPGPLPRAVFCLNDNLAIGVLSVLRERGLRVPEDVAVVGFDDIEAARHLGLTSVNVPLNDIGRAAAEAAIGSIGPQGAISSVVLPTRLVRRRSCGCA
jgi:LacI family transcriptional regulator